MTRRRGLLVLCLLVGVAVGVVIGITFLSDDSSSGPREALATSAVSYVPGWVEKEHLSGVAVRGATVFATAGCTNCHTYAGSGSTNLHAPDLTAIGSRHLGIDFQLRHLKCPSCVNPGSPMPPFEALGPLRLRQLALFLEASKGER